MIYHKPVITGVTVSDNTITSTGFIKTAGTGAQALMANGTVMGIGTGINTLAAGDHTHASYALVGQTMYIGTTAVAINRGSAALTLAGITLTTPVIGVATGTSFNSITGLASSNPLMNGTVAIGTSPLVARQDHVHASDTSREPGLGNPLVSGYVLSSTTGGVRSWVAQGAGGGGTGTVTSVTAGNGMTQTGTLTIDPTLNIVSHAGAAGTIGTINIGADAIGVNLGNTATTACSGADARLSDARTPSSHAHGNITFTGYLGSTATIPLITGVAGLIQAGSFGTSAGTFCVGNDARLSDARTPSSHTLGFHSNVSTTVDSSQVTGQLLRWDGTEWNKWTPTYIASYTETDTLATVTGRGATTAVALSITNATASTSAITGALKVTGGVGVGGAVYVTGSVSASDFIGTSDRTLKENITPVTNKYIPSLYRNFNFKGFDEFRTGVIAQELELTNPEFVRTGSDGIKAVAYLDLHSAEIAYLKNKIAELENLILKYIS